MSLKLPFELLLYTRSYRPSKSLQTLKYILQHRRRTYPRPYSSHSAVHTAQSTTEPAPTQPYSEHAESHLNPSPSSFSLTPFTDKCTISLFSGSGGHGCVSFVREKFIPEGPANGGDGGTGGSIYIQAVRGETSLHKLAKRPILKAARGQNGKGKSQGGQRGEDILISVPVGTIVREIERYDPVAEEQRALMERRRLRGRKTDVEEPDPDESARAKFIIFPGPLTGRDIAGAEAGPPQIPRLQFTRPGLITPPAPIHLDLNTPSERPILLAAGAVGGLGNPHFVTKETTRPKYATKGSQGMNMSLQLELKVLADVGLVGLPNAGKSTLLRALTRSRTRVGNWAFTTLQPSIGTVVLDDHTGRPALPAFMQGSGENGAPRERRTQFTIADIPGLIEDAHLDKGLGLGFLRHVERALCLCFVLDLSDERQDAVKGLESLWREVAEYEVMRAREVSAESERRVGSIVRLGAVRPDNEEEASLADSSPSPPITSKPWFVVATKADLPGTQENYESLKSYVDAVNQGKVEHPSGRRNAWKQDIRLIPVSAIKAEGVQAIPRIVIDLLG